MKKFNEWLAVRATLIFGSMYTTYLFFLYGFAPVLFPNLMDKLLYWSNTVQLWSLPLLMVGQNVIGRASEKRAQETHDAVIEELAMVKEELKLARDERQDIKIVLKDVHHNTKGVKC
ncbi:hypothetical protein [Desulfosporosinus sp. FKA]|uniref:hypothetical protein n=1 Tax=Desulfosporosinus sp. FKA TaxID=1969834 RepID=UPI000B499A8B|nr:hypothetical protein [Desulfosporosinus sp. FKA]